VWIGDNPGYAASQGWHSLTKTALGFDNTFMLLSGPMTDAALLQQIADKKAELDRLRPQAPHAFGNANRAQDVELTYSSNAATGAPRAF
jgi:hypothetical protein